MPLEFDRIVDIGEHGEVRYKQSAPTLHFQLDGKDFDIHPLDMPLYFGDVRSEEQFNFLARTVSQLGAYFRHGLKNIPDPKNKTSRERRERKLKATHETQLALMTLAPLLKLNRYSQCTRQEFGSVIKQIDRKIDEIFADKDEDAINNALKDIIKNRLARIKAAAKAQNGTNIDVTALHLYSDVVDLSEALLQGLQERSNLELAARGALRWRFRGDNLYTNIQKAKVFVRDPQNQRRGHGQALNDANFGLFAPSDSKKTHEKQQQDIAVQEEEQEAIVQEDAAAQEEERYLDPTHYGMGKARIAKYCDYLEALAPIEAEARAADPQHVLLETEATNQEEQTAPVKTRERKTLAQQLKDERSKHEPTKAAVTRNSWYLHRAGRNNLLAAGPAALAVVGAAAGTAIPIIGTIIGAAVGAGIGYLASAAHHAIVVEGEKNGGYSGFFKRLGAGLAAPIVYVANAAEVAARPVIRWGQKALLGWGRTKNIDLDILTNAGAELDLSPDLPADMQDRDGDRGRDGDRDRDRDRDRGRGRGRDRDRGRGLVDQDATNAREVSEQPPAKAKKTAAYVAAPTQLTLDTGGGLSSIPATVAVFAKHITDPLSSVFRSNPNIGVALHAFLWGPLGAITALKAAGASHLSHIELSLVKAYDYISNTFSGSTGTLGAIWAWVVPGKLLELLILDPLANPLKQTELFGPFFERIEQIKDDPGAHPQLRTAAFAANKLIQVVLALAVTGAAANLAAPLIARAFKLMNMEVDFGSNPIGEVWNDILVMTKGSALATSMMLFNNQPEHIVRDTSAVLTKIIEKDGKQGPKLVEGICDNLTKLQQLSQESFEHLSEVQKSQVRARFHALKRVFGVELMYSLVPGEKFDIRPPAPTNLLGKAVNWVVSVPIGICRAVRHPVAVGLPAIANFAAGMLALGAVTKQFVSGLSSKVFRGNTLMNWVGRVVSGGNDAQGVADNLQAKYNNKRPDRSWVFSPAKSWSRFQHWVQRGLTNCMQRCTAYAMAGKNTLPKSPALVKKELKGITGLEGHPLIQGDGFNREPEPGREARPDPELAREPEPSSLLDDVQQRGSTSPTPPIAVSLAPEHALAGDASAGSVSASPTTSDASGPMSQPALTVGSAPVTTVTAAAPLNDLWGRAGQPHSDLAEAASGPSSYSTSSLIRNVGEAEEAVVVATTQSLPARSAPLAAAAGE